MQLPNQANLPVMRDTPRGAFAEWIEVSQEFDDLSCGNLHDEGGNPTPSPPI
jgi:hypothetical protein